MSSFYFEIGKDIFILIKAGDFWEALNKSKNFIDVSNTKFYLREQLPENKIIAFNIN